MLAKWLSRLVVPMVLLLSTGCSGSEVVLPYVAQIQSVEPEVPGLEIRATAGGGGELEIINRTGQEVILLDEQDTPFARLASDGVYERIEGTWQKTKDTLVYYCHDPRIRYDGPEPTSTASLTVKQWTIPGRIGDKPFTIKGRTVYRGGTTLEQRLAWPAAGAALCCLGMLVASAAVLVVIWKRRERSLQTEKEE